MTERNCNETEYTFQKKGIAIFQNTHYRCNGNTKEVQYDRMHITGEGKHFRGKELQYATTHIIGEGNCNMKILISQKGNRHMTAFEKNKLQ